MVVLTDSLMIALDQTGETTLAPSAVAVGLSTAHILLCHHVIGDAGLLVHVARGAIDVACNDIARSVPQVVVTSDAVGRSGLARLEDVSIAVGAVFLVLDESADLETVALDVEAAVVVASARVEHRSSRPPSC